MKVTAEGVETEEQIEFLIKENCDIFQGYYFSKPLSVKDIEKDILESSDNMLITP